MKKLIMILTCIIASVGLSVAQTTTKVSGTIVDDTGETVIGASVVAKGTTVGTVTDVDGKFSLNIPSDKKILVISLIGLRTKEVAAGQNLRIVLENDSKLMDEVVVTGYGVQKRGTFTGAATTVKSDVMTELSVTSADKALQGNAPGLLTQASSGQPGAGQRIVIRGIGSINAGTEPLWIVDGVPVATGNYGLLTSTGETTYSDNSNALAGINPNDIETVTVLKDAAATSIYGARASNGVVLITTKSGKDGKTSFSLNANYGWSSRATKKFETMNQSEYIDYISDARINAGLQSSKDDVISYLKENIFPTDASGNFYNFNWLDETYQVAPTYSINFQASGGNQKTKYFSSIGYMNEDGILDASGMNRVSARLNISHNYSDKLRFGMNTALSFSKRNVPLTTSSYYANPILASAILPAVDPGKINGEIQELSLLSANFLANIAYNYNKQRIYNVVSSAFGEYDIIKGLTFRSAWGVNFMQVNESAWDDPKTPGNTASDPAINGRATRTSGEVLIWNTTNTLNYNTVIGEVHDLNVLVGQEANSEGYRSMESEGEGFPSADYKELNAAANPSYVNSDKYDVRVASFLSRVNYSYDNRYMFSASFRQDGSSRFAKDNRYASFWSVGGQWKITSEEFMKPTAGWLTNLALRMSYGTAGNSDIKSRSTAPVLDGRYPSMGIYRPGANYNGVSGIYPYQIENKNLKWERSESFNVGVDYSMFNNRINGTIEFYNKDTKDLLLARNVSSTTGFTAAMQNVGSIRNRGIEFSINAVPVSSKDFQWNVSFNISHNKNTVLELYNGQEEINGTRILKEGEDFQSIYTYKWAGVDSEDGNPMWYAADGSKVKDYTKAQKSIVGSASPDFFGSLTNSFKYKNFDISAMLYFSQGNDISDQTLNMINAYGARTWWNQSKDLVNRWRNPGDVTDVPKVVFGDTKRAPMSSKYVYDGSYIRLRNLNVGYTMPFVKGLRVYFQGTNLLTFTSYKGLDPEVGINGDPWFGYPVAKTITFGLDYKF